MRRLRTMGPTALCILTGLIATRTAPAPAQQPVDSSARGSPCADATPLVTDRPDFTESTASVATGRFQVETGYTLSRDEGTDEHAVGEVLLRIGVSRWLELRVAPASYTLVRGPERSIEGLADPSLGAKATLLEPAPDASDVVPAVTFLTSTSLPTGHDALNPDGVQPSAAVALGWDVGARVSLGANLERAHLLSEGERYGRTAASVALGISATNRLGAYLEFYTLRPTVPGSGNGDVVDGGLTFLLGPDAQIDARLGTGLGPQGPDLILGVGLAVRR